MLAEQSEEVAVELLLILALGFRGLLVRTLVQIEIAPAGRSQPLLFEIREPINQEFVHRVGEEQDFVPFLDKALDHRRVLDDGARLPGDVVDRVLTLLHALDIPLECRELFGIRRGCEQQQRDDPVLLVGLRANAFLDGASELVPELEVLHLVVALQVGEHVQHLLGEKLANPGDVTVFLQGLAGNVQRQVGGIHDTAHEAQEVRQGLLAALLDHHPTGVQLQAVLRPPHVQVRRRFGRDEQQRLVLRDPFRLESEPQHGILPSRCDVLVELVVLLVLDFRFRSCPDRLHGVQRLVIEHDRGLAVRRFDALLVRVLLLALDPMANRVADVIRVALHCVLENPLVSEVFDAGIGVDSLQVQRDARSRLGFRSLGDRVGAVRVRFPVSGAVLPCLAGIDLHLLGHHERRVEAHAEATDQIGQLGALGLLAEVLEHFLGARTGDRTDVVDHFLTRHADPVVVDLERSLVSVRFQANLEVGALALQLLFRKGAKAQLVEGVGRVRDEFAQEDFLVGVQGMDH